MNSVRGRIIEGLGVGGKIIQDYLAIFKKELKMDIFPGTLNLQLEMEFNVKWDGYIEPFTKIDGTKRGGVWYLKAKMKNFPVFIIRPELTKHPKNIIEIISPINIRKQYGLKDGDILEVSLM